MVSQKAGSPGRNRISRKAIAQGRPDASAKPVCSCACLMHCFARETAGAARTRSSLRPLIFRGARLSANFGRTASRKCEVVSSRHCERSEAIHGATRLDCFVAIASRNDSFGSLKIESEIFAAVSLTLPWRGRVGSHGAQRAVRRGGGIFQLVCCSCGEPGT